MGNELFQNIPSKVKDLVSDIINGRIGLPDLQRPFVWKDAKVRDLLDSMLKGYPIGYIILWESPVEYKNTSYIGQNNKIYKQPDDLVIDGQQRLTALVAALEGIPVKDNNYKERNIKISFNPLKKEFSVWTSATEKNTEWISTVSEIFAAYHNDATSKLRRAYIKAVNDAREKEAKPLLTDEEEDLIERNITELISLGTYELPTLKISTQASEEDVSDIFKRVNSGGQNLTEKNFIETLLAVYDNEVHTKINKFCEESRIPAQGTSYNQILVPDPAHLIRMAVGLGFKRARLRYAYLLLRGKDLDKGIFSEQIRKDNLDKFKLALNTVIDMNNWHAFMNLFASAGYLKDDIISSSYAVVFSYIFYLIGKNEYKVQTVELQKIIRKWIFMSTITSFYAGSAETEVERQFADLRDVKTANEFVQYLEKEISKRFTDDYFKVTLVGDLNSSSANSPTWFGYIAAINVLGTPMLFSTTPLSHYFTLGTAGSKNSIDKHHIFPKHYLETIGFDDDRDRNQIANFTYLDYQTNIDISDDEPKEYVGRFRAKLGEDGYKLACEQNALPEDFEKLPYLEFLEKRRVLMAGIIKKAYDKLCE